MENDKKNYCTFYIIRHGETDWNKKNHIQGQKDIRLNGNGIRQAKEAAQLLKHIHFDHVYSSDLLRAKRTAEIIALEHKLAVETTTVLRERQLGTFEGKPMTLLTTLDEDLRRLSGEEKEAFKSKHAVEDTDEMASRFITFLRETAIANPRKTILVASHGMLIKVLLTHLGFLRPDETVSSKIANAGYIILESDGVDFFITEMKGLTKEHAS